MNDINYITDLSGYENKLIFIPLGGTNEIGLNVTLYHLNGKWIMVDCGSGFASDNLPGVDIILPDLSFIAEYKKDLLGLILTHIHEDHLGGIQYLWDNLECPIYTTKFTKSFLHAKLAEANFKQAITIKEIEADKSIELGPFSIEPIALTHSTIEMHALMIRTEAGNILHTGDWKFDPEPVIGKTSDEEALEKCSKDGVLALVCDSTNVFNKGVSGSEIDVQKSLFKIISKCKQTVLVTTFASNLARIISLIKIAKETKRKIVICGRSLDRILKIARKHDYISEDVEFIDEIEASKCKKSELLIIATGCQGERFAATKKIAYGNNPNIHLAKGDTVIFSSKIIPGNDKPIFALINKFTVDGIEVVSELNNFVHVSGHPSIDELKKMYQLTKPSICVPVHGEPMHTHQQAELAKGEKIKFSVIPENGTVILLDKDNPTILGKVPSGYLGLDGNSILPVSSGIFSMRRKMQLSGLVTVHIILNKSGKILSKPQILTPGLLDARYDQDLIELLHIKVGNVIKTMPNIDDNVRKNKLEGAVKSELTKLIKQELKKMPVIMVNIERI